MAQPCLTPSSSPEFCPIDYIPRARIDLAHFKKANLGWGLEEGSSVPVYVDICPCPSFCPEQGSGRIGSTTGKPRRCLVKFSPGGSRTLYTNSLGSGCHLSPQKAKGEGWAPENSGEKA